MMDIFTTGVLTGVINSLVEPPQHLLSAYFPFVSTAESEEIQFDVIDSHRRLAPFVSPVVAGKLIEEKGFSTKTFKPAYIKAKSVFDPTRPLRRMSGEQIGGSPRVPPEERIKHAVAQTLAEHRDMIDRRLEVMAAEVLLTGSETIEGDQYPRVQLDFGRDPSLTITRPPGAKWGDAGVDALDDLQDWARLVLKKCSARCDVVTMDVDTWQVFRKLPEVQDRLEVRRAQGAELNLGHQAREGGFYMGVIDGFHIWVYSGWYLDDEGNELPILPSGTVILGGNDMQGVRAFGAIRDEMAGYQSLEYFSKSWLDEDPSVRYMLTQSAPLIVPTRPNAWVTAQVL